MRSPELDWKTRVALIGAAFLAAAGLKFGIGGLESVHADGPTPSVSPTRTVTPDALATQIANAQATVTAAAEQFKKEKQLAALNATATAISQQRDTLLTPATPEPKANEILAAVETVAQGRLNEKATATARAEGNFTPTPRSVFAPTPAGGTGSEGSEDGFTWGEIIVIGSVATVVTGAVYWFLRRHS